MLSIGRLVPVWPISNSAPRSIVCSWQSFSDGWPSEAVLHALNSVPQSWPCLNEQQAATERWLSCYSNDYYYSHCLCVLLCCPEARWGGGGGPGRNQLSNEHPLWEGRTGRWRKAVFLPTHLKCDNNILFPSAKAVLIRPYVSPGLIFSEIITSSRDCS